MKLWSSFLTALAGAVACTIALSAQGANSVVNSKHNLNISFAPGTIVNNEVCKACHTPHQQPAQNVADNVSTLWNHTMNPNTAYGTTGLPGGTIDESSRKCLGCHDGTIAVDNYGGHGGPSTTGFMPAGFIVGGNGNLSHDHPIDVKYTAAAVTTVTTGAVTAVTTNWTSTSKNDPAKMTTSGYSTGGQPVTVSTDATDPLHPIVTTTTGTSTYAASTYKQLSNGVEVSATATRGISFYSPSGSTDKYVYCGSCHTPHDNTYGFLKITNYKSQLCLTCHVR
jgi:predicted CXXCH cytochrome family protein